MNLLTELKELFIDHEKNEGMMNEGCMYDPESPVYDHSKGYSNRKLIGTREVYKGYGKELTEMGVEFKNVDSYGGEEQGRDYWSVWEFSRKDEVVRFKFEGWYASYQGAEFEHVYEVKPKEKTIIVWE